MKIIMNIMISLIIGMLCIVVNADNLAIYSHSIEFSGFISKISPNGQHVIIQNDDLLKLVEIESGEIVHQILDGWIRFSDEGNYVYFANYMKQSKAIPKTTVMNLKSKQTYSFDGIIFEIVEDQRHFVRTIGTESPANPISFIHELSTSEVSGVYFGVVGGWSHNAKHLVVHILEETQRRFKVIDLANNIVVAEYTYPIPEHVFSYGISFNADDSILSLYFFPEQMQIIDTDTWEVLYTLAGGISFSADGKYILHNNHAGYSEVQLLEAYSGEVVDELLGAIYLVQNDKYLVRGEGITFTERNWQVFDFETGKLRLEENNHLGAPTIYDDEIASFWDFGLKETRFYDLRTGELMREVYGLVERFGHYIVVYESHAQKYYLRNFEDTVTLAESVYPIKVTSDNKYALVRNDERIDVYILNGKN